MSGEEMTRALAATDMRTITKFVLVILADQATGDGCAYTTIDHLATRTLLSVDSVERCLSELELAGRISVLARRAGNCITVRFIDPTPPEGARP